MGHSFFKGALVGGMGAMAVMAATVAWAANGGNFILGTSNSATNPTVLTGAGAAGMLRVVDTHTTATAPAIHGLSANPNQPGVRGENSAADGVGVFGNVAGTSSGAGVGIEGRSTNGTGIRGNHVGTTGASPGVSGLTASPAGVGVLGTASAGTGTGVRGVGGSTGVGVSATGGSKGIVSSVTASSAVGISSTAGSSSNDAIQGTTSSSTGDALQGVTSGAAAFGVFAIATGGGVGVVSSSGPGYAFAGNNSSSNNATVIAGNSALNGSAGSFTGDTALKVRNGGQTFGTGLDANVSGDTNGNGNASDDGNNAIVAVSDDINNSAVITAQTVPSGSDEFTAEAIEAFGFVDINGSARVTGNLNVVGTCCGPLIDNPIDPANSYLRHASVASSEMKNLYDGTLTTDGSGKATVQLAAWFGAMNRDFRYQLTTIGSFAQAVVWKEIPAGGRSFEIRTNQPNVKVSWQVTGIRNDAYAQAHPLQVVEPKTGEAAGMYLHPELFGQPNARPLGLDLPAAPANSAAAQAAQADMAALVHQKAQQAIRESAR